MDTIYESLSNLTKSIVLTILPLKHVQLSYFQDVTLAVLLSIFSDISVSMPSDDTTRFYVEKLLFNFQIFKLHTGILLPVPELSDKPLQGLKKIIYFTPFPASLQVRERNISKLEFEVQENIAHHYQEFVKLIVNFQLSFEEIDCQAQIQKTKLYELQKVVNSLCIILGNSHEDLIDAAILILQKFVDGEQIFK